MAKDKWDLSSKLRSARISLGMTQGQAADHLNIGRSSYVNYEKGHIPRDQAVRGTLRQWVETNTKPPFTIKSSIPEEKSALVKIVEILDSYKKTPNDMKRLKELITLCADVNCNMNSLGMLIGVIENNRATP